MLKCDASGNCVARELAQQTRGCSCLAQISSMLRVREWELLNKAERFGVNVDGIDAKVSFAVG